MTAEQDTDDVHPQEAMDDASLPEVRQGIDGA